MLSEVDVVYQMLLPVQVRALARLLPGLLRALQLQGRGHLGRGPLPLCQQGLGLLLLLLALLALALLQLLALGPQQSAVASTNEDQLA
jgi:hypothetical protein